MMINDSKSILISIYKLEYTVLNVCVCVNGYNVAWHGKMADWVTELANASHAISVV